MASVVPPDVTSSAAVSPQCLLRNVWGVFQMCGFLWLWKEVSPLFMFFHSATNRSNVRCSQTHEFLFIFYSVYLFQHLVQNLSLSGEKTQGKALLSTLTQRISAHRATVQKFVNTRRNSTRRSFVLLCGVSSEVLGRVCWGKAAAGEVGGIWQLDFAVVSHLSCQKILRTYLRVTRMVLPSWRKMANRWVTVARDFVHQNEKTFWSSTKLKLCLP